MRRALWALAAAVLVACGGEADADGPPEIVHGLRSITADTALRLARYFDTSERFWLNLQSRFDLESEKDRLGSRLDRVVRRSV